MTRIAGIIHQGGLEQTESILGEMADSMLPNSSGTISLRVISSRKLAARSGSVGLALIESDFKGSQVNKFLLGEEKDDIVLVFDGTVFNKQELQMYIGENLHDINDEIELLYLGYCKMGIV